MNRRLLVETQSCQKCDKRPSWDETFFGLIEVLRLRSKDSSFKQATVIVGKDHEILSMGYNCFPRDINDNAKERQERPAKYLYFEHAERNAIYNAARNGIALKNTTIYLLWLPCADCARAIIQSGITEVVVRQDFVMPDRWKESMDASVAMLQEAGVSINYK